jgi:hypothetical protein
MIGSVIIFAWTRPRARDVAAMVALAGILFALRLAIEPDIWSILLVRYRRFGFFLGWASIAMLARSAPSPAFTGAVALPLFVQLRWLGIVLFGLNSGPTADAQMFLLDQSFGNPIYGLGQWVALHPFVRSVFGFLYRALIWTLPVAYAAAFQDRVTRNRLLVSWMVASALSVPCYFLVPVAGPAYAFSGWPYPPSGVTWAPLTTVRPGLLRTGMPSLHLVWALLTWLLAPAEPRWVRRAMLAFVGITVLTTLALGQHWVVDLIPSLPFTAVVIWITRRLVPTPAQKPVSRRLPSPYASATFMAAIGCWLGIFAFGLGGGMGVLLGVIAAGCAWTAAGDYFRLQLRGDPEAPANEDSRPG